MQVPQEGLEILLFITIIIYFPDAGLCDIRATYLLVGLHQNSRITPERTPTRRKPIKERKRETTEMITSQIILAGLVLAAAVLAIHTELTEEPHLKAPDPADQAFIPLNSAA